MKSVCSQYADIEHIKVCANKAAAWCPDLTTRRECIGEIERERAAKEQEAKRAQEAAKRAQHDAWCADLERQLPELFVRARVRQPFGMGLPYWAFRNFVPQNDCPNVERAIDRMYGARISPAPGD
jgi:hypothetical protein